MRKQGGFSIELAVYGIIAAALLAIGGYASYKWLDAKLLEAEQRAERAEEDAERSKAESKELKEDLNESNNATQRKARELATSQRELGEFKRKLAALTSNPEIAKYLATVRPDDLRRLRRESARCSGDLSVPCTGSLGPRDPGTSNGGSDERGVRGGSEEGKDSVAVVQPR